MTGGEHVRASTEVGKSSGRQEVEGTRPATSAPGKLHSPSAWRDESPPKTGWGSDYTDEQRDR